MSQSHQFQAGNIKVELKNAESNDNPGELMIVGMPIAKNVDMSKHGSVKLDCPLCNKPCWASPHIIEAAKIYKDRLIAACTECSLKAHMDKGAIPRRLAMEGLHPRDVLQPILDQFKS